MNKIQNKKVRTIHKPKKNMKSTPTPSFVSMKALKEKFTSREIIIYGKNSRNRN